MKSFKRTIITTDSELENVCNRLIEKETLSSVDSETLGLDCRRAKLRLVQISGRTLQETFIIDYFKIINPEPLRRFMLHYSPKLNYNGQFDNCFFLHNFNAYIEFPVDLFLGAQLLLRYGLPPGIKPDSNEARRSKLVPYLKDVLVERRRGGHGILTLKSVMKLFTGIEISKEMQISDWSGELSDQQLDYAAKDTELLFPLFDTMMDEIMKEGLVDAFCTENGCQLATSMMHYYGIKLDMNEMKLLDNEISTKIKQLESNVAEYPEFHSDSPSLLDLMNGVTTSINIGSHDQVIQALTKRWGSEWWKTVGMDKPSTQAADLKKFHDRDPELVAILSQRASLQSMYSNHVEGLSSHIDPITGRIHSNYMQNASPQQRFSSDKPILLNIPNVVSYGLGVSNQESPMHSKRSFRDLFVAEEGCLFVKCDYKALQLMALAQESNDTTLIEIFNKDLDAHKITASAITGKPEDQINKAERYTGKTCGYAVGFVCGPQRLQNTFAQDDVHYTLQECKTFIERYMKKYPGVKRYHNSRSETARRNHKVWIEGGRATLLHGDVGDRPSDLTNFPMALYEVSGGKYAAMRIARICFLLKEHGVKIARFVLMVHDEIMIEIDECYAKVMAEVLEREMIQSMTRYIHKVPIGAETTICKTWGGKAVEPRESKPLPIEIKRMA